LRPVREVSTPKNAMLCLLVAACAQCGPKRLWAQSDVFDAQGDRLAHDHIKRVHRGERGLKISVS
jgi:predicted CoA-binding protein